MTTTSEPTATDTSQAEWAAEARLPSPDVAVLDAIFSIAISHDTRCQRTEDELYRYVGYRGRAGAGHADGTLVKSGTFEDLEGHYRYAIVGLCASIAAASLKRIPTLHAFADKIIDSGLLVELTGEQLERFLRPIFDESGIGDRFEVREGYEVFRTAADD